MVGSMKLMRTFLKFLQLISKNFMNRNTNGPFYENHENFLMITSKQLISKNFMNEINLASFL